MGERTNGSGHKKDGASHGLTTLTVRFKYAALPAASTAVKRILKPVWFAGVGCEVLMKQHANPSVCVPQAHYPPFQI